MQGVFILLCIHHFPLLCLFYPSPLSGLLHLFLFLPLSVFAPLLFLSSHLCNLFHSVVPVMHVRALRGMRKRRKGSAGPELEKTPGNRGWGGERKLSSRPITPSEHLKLPGRAFKCSLLTFPHQSLPIPQACQDSVNGEKHIFSSSLSCFKLPPLLCTRSLFFFFLYTCQLLY